MTYNLEALEELAAGIRARTRAQFAARELRLLLEELEADRHHLEAMQLRKTALELEIVIARGALELRRQELAELERWHR